MEKDFENWNTLKQKIDINSKTIYSYPREIWWCSLGVNIGAEINGKHEVFERPIIVLKVYNKETLLVLPLTTKIKEDRFHMPITFKDKKVWAKLTQVRVISNKRLIRKIDVLDETQFDELLKIWKDSI